MTASDNELLERYVSDNDQAAFEQLIRRHAPMVLSVCQSLLWQKEDAEDSFQAVFLLLSTKAPKLLKHCSVGGWLHESAFRTSLKHRGKIARQREVAMQNEIIDNKMEPWQTIAASRDTELLHHEISKLPKRYRDVIVLCHLEGNSRAQAASALSVSTESVKASLARGRKLLRRRLLKQGVAITVVLGAMPVLSGAAAVSGSALAAATVNAASATSSTSALASTTVSDLLIQSTLQHCQGLTPGLGVGTSAGVVQSLIAKEGAIMTWGITQTSLAAAASIVTACALSIGAIAQLSAGQGDQQEITIGVDTELEVQQSQVAVVPATQNENPPASQESGTTTGKKPPTTRGTMGGMMSNMMGSAQADLASVQASPGLSKQDLAEQILIAENKLQQYRGTYHESHPLVCSAKETLAQLQKLMRETQAQATPNIDSQQSKFIDEQIVKTQIELHELRTRLGVGHPSVLAIERKLKMLRAMLETQNPASNDGTPRTAKASELSGTEQKLVDSMKRLVAETERDQLKFGDGHPVVAKLKSRITFLLDFLTAPAKDTQWNLLLPDVTAKSIEENWDDYVDRLRQLNYMTDEQVKQWKEGLDVVLEPGIRVTKMREVIKLGYRPVEKTREVLKDGKLVTESFKEYVRQEIKTLEPYTIPSHGTLALPIRGSQPDNVARPGATYPYNRATYDAKKNVLPPTPKHQLQTGDSVRARFEVATKIDDLKVGKLIDGKIYKLAAIEGMWCSVDGVKGWLPTLLIEKVDLNPIDLPAEETSDLLLENYVPKELPAEVKQKFR